MKKNFTTAIAMLAMATMVNAQFSVYDADGNVLYSSEMTPAYVDFTYHNPMTIGNPVDLGLSVLWADINVGANSPEETGDYYAWGETTTKENYDWNTYFDTEDNGSTFKKYNLDDGKTELEFKDDAAAVNWKGTWRMPTQADQDDLRIQCYWVWTTTYKGKNVNGYIVYKAKDDADKGKYTNDSNSSHTPSATYEVTNDAHIFLPASGFCLESDLSFEGRYGYYMSSTLCDSYMDYARNLAFTSYSAYWASCYRRWGHTVRAVSPKPAQVE